MIGEPRRQGARFEAWKSRRRISICAHLMISKHSTTLHGHRTSFSLEEEFWAELKAIANTRAISLAALIAEIDDARAPESNLSSALRIHVLHWLKQQTSQR